MRTLLIVCSLGFLGATTAIAEPNHQIALGSSTRALRSNSANALTGDSLSGTDLTYAYHLPVDVMPRLAVWAEGGIEFGSADGMMFQTLTTRLDSTAYTVGGRARYELLSRVALSARLAFGTAHTSMSLSDSAGHSVSDIGWGGITTGTVGLDLLAIDRPKFGLGIRVELGYAVTSAVALSATPDRPTDDTLKLPTMDATLGHLDLGGPSFGIAVTSRF